MLCTVIGLIAMSAYCHLAASTSADPDGFYHYGQAAVYATQGPWMRGLPWMAHSAIDRLQGNAYYGFDVLLIPFTWVRDPVLGLRLAGAAVLAAYLLIFYALVRRHRVPLPALWPFLLLFASPGSLWRSLAVRPYLFSTVCTVLLCSLLCRGRLRYVFACAFLIAWVHANLSPLILGAMGAVLLVRLVSREPVSIRPYLAALAGMAAGVFLRPAPIGTIRLAFLQLGGIADALRQHLPLTFGAEVYRARNEALFSLWLPFLCLWLAAVAVLLYGVLTRRLRVPRETSCTLWSSLLLSVGFFWLGMSRTSRGIDIWQAFAVLVVALVTDALVRACRLDRAPAWRAWAARACAVGGLAALAWWSTAGVRQQLDTIGIDPYRLEPAMSWLKQNSPEGSVVFSPHWTIFSEMFFWNRHNRYVNGLDPIYIYLADRRLCWMVMNLELRKSAGTVSSSVPGTPGPTVDTYTALRQDFHARYLLVVKVATPELYAAASSDPRYRLVHDSDTVAIYDLGQA